MRTRRLSFSDSDVFTALLAALAIVVSACNGSVAVGEPGECGGAGGCDGKTSTDCGAPGISCGGECVDPLDDSENCGGCGVVCAEGQCVEGDCLPQAVCPEGLSACGPSCHDLSSDPLNCGACGEACGPESSCVGGVCQAKECACGAICSLVVLESVVPQDISGDTSSNTSQVSPSCTGTAGSDVVFSFTSPLTGKLRFDTSGSTFDTVLQIMDPECGVIICNNDVAADGTSQVFADLSAGQQVFIVVDSHDGVGGALQLHIIEDAGCASCNDIIALGNPYDPCPGESLMAYKSLNACVCAGVCEAACGTNVCDGLDITAECETCVGDPQLGCGDELEACLNDL